MQNWVMMLCCCCCCRILPWLREMTVQQAVMNLMMIRMLRLLMVMTATSIQFTVKSVRTARSPNKPHAAAVSFQALGCQKHRENVSLGPALKFCGVLTVTCKRHIMTSCIDSVSVKSSWNNVLILFMFINTVWLLTVNNTVLCYHVPMMQCF